MDKLSPTFNFIPSLILGKTIPSSSYAINLITRVISLFICFKINPKPSPWSILGAIIFPTVYIIYMIALNGMDTILGLFDIERDFLDNIFSSSSEKCVERRGPDGDRRSIDADRIACSKIVLNRKDTKENCRAVKSVGDPTMDYPANEDACRYIPGDKKGRYTEWTTCSDYNAQGSCDANSKCSWDSYDTCRGDKVLAGWDENDPSSHLPQNCPSVCSFVNKGSNGEMNIVKESEVPTVNGSDGSSGTINWIAETATEHGTLITKLGEGWSDADYGPGNSPKNTLDLITKLRNGHSQRANAYKGCRVTLMIDGDTWVRGPISGYALSNNLKYAKITMKLNKNLLDNSGNDVKNTLRDIIHEIDTGGRDVKARIHCHSSDIRQKCSETDDCWPPGTGCSNGTCASTSAGGSCDTGSNSVILDSTQERYASKFGQPSGKCRTI